MQKMDAGRIARSWDGKDEFGAEAPAGDYQFKVAVNRATYRNVGAIGNSGLPPDPAHHTPAAMLSVVPQGRWCEPEEIADVVVFLCSDGASHVTGHIMPRLNAASLGSGRHTDPRVGYYADPRFGFVGTIADAAESEAVGGNFHPQIFGWMVHVYPFAGTDDLKVAFGMDAP